MKIVPFSSTPEILAELGHRIKTMRIDMSITQKELAMRTNLSMRTISNLETGKDVSFSTVIEVLRALGKLPRLDLLIAEQQVRPSQIVALGKPRERASSKAAPKNETTPWKWGDEV